MNEQSRTAFNIFTDFYGEPKWMKEPKDGQNPETIIQQWSDELKGYTIDQIRQACAWITRKRRVMTFPTLDVLLCELSDKEKTSNPDNEVQSCLKTLIGEGFSDLAIQRTMWKTYGFKYKDYQPEKDMEAQ
jgi:hypothetical protein